MAKSSRELLERSLAALRMAREAGSAAAVLDLERVALEYLRQADRARQRELEGTPIKGA
jgi:hypothetical protein